MSLELIKLLPPSPKVTRGKRFVLGADPKGMFLLYTSGNSVILLHMKDVSKNDMYTQHAVSVNVAKYSPSGFYIASADKYGKVRIWDTVNLEHILKNEFQPFSGPICDLAWTSDNQKILVGGSGQSQYGAVFNAETGSSVGTIMGMSRNINSVDFRPMRPFRAVAGNDEGAVTFFEGPPFTFKHNEKNHSAFLNVVAYCPSGKCFVSGGADGKLFVYNGETGLTIGEVGNPAHAGGIYGVAFSKDGARMVSVSADKSLKLWQVEGESITLLSHYLLEGPIGNMILGCTWLGDLITAVTLSGYIYVFAAPPDVTSLAAPHAVYYGHSMPITAGAFSPQHSVLVTSSSDGSVAVWNMETGMAQMVTGQSGHKSQIQGLVLVSDHVVTVGLDDRCILSSLKDREILTSVKLPSQPHSIGIFIERLIVVVACENHIVLLEVSGDNLALIDQLPINLGSSKIAVSPKTGAAIICTFDEKLLCFKTHTGKVEKTSLVNAPSSPITMAAFSSDGAVLALAAADRTITVYTIQDGFGSDDMPTLSRACPEWWQRHNARVTALAWSPNSRRLASGSLDTSVIVWSLDEPKKAIVLRNAHPMSSSTSLSWPDNSSVVSTAQDSSIRHWKIKDA